MTEKRKPQSLEIYERFEHPEDLTNAEAMEIAHEAITVAVREYTISTQVLVGCASILMRAPVGTAQSRSAANTVADILHALEMTVRDPAYTGSYEDRIQLIDAFHETVKAHLDMLGGLGGVF